MSNDSSDDENLPSAEECDKRCKEFAEITGTNPTLGWFFLQDRDWDVARSVDAFFEQGGAEALGGDADAGGATAAVTTAKSSKSQFLSECASRKVPDSWDDSDNSDGEVVGTKDSQDTREDKTPKPTASEVGDTEPQRIRLISWNIDGLSEECRARRTQAVCEIINKEDPDVVFLQEVVPDTVEILKENCLKYGLICRGIASYFTGVMFKVSTVVIKEVLFRVFENSRQGRTILCARALVKGVSMFLLTSHLESGGSVSTTRSLQLNSALKDMTDLAHDATVVFGGDMNLRDYEVPKLPWGVHDLWELTGKRPECKYTWDKMHNDNIATPGDKKTTRKRFDRIFLRHPKPKRKVLKVVRFELIGQERVPDARMFPSDHWGLLAHFDILQKPSTLEQATVTAAKPSEAPSASDTGKVPENWGDSDSSDCEVIATKAPKETKEDEAPKQSANEKGETNKEPSEGTANEEGATKDEPPKQKGTDGDGNTKPERIRLISWNIDGLSRESMPSRTKAVCDTINKEDPDVVYLQEVVPESVRILEENCPMYQLVAGGATEYFTVIMLKVSTVVYKDRSIKKFPCSTMGRNILSVQASVKDVAMALMTSHLESTAEYSAERVRQLRVALKDMTNAPPDATVVFGGDMNLRDKELAGLGGLPEGVFDLWELTGSRPECRYTWDLTRNDNLVMPGNFKARLRFDRLYLRHPKPKPAPLKPVYFELIGLERIPNGRRFPSDHWGLLVHFDVLKKLAKKL